MLPELITSPEQVSAVWLTEVLRRSGALRSGAVADVDPEAGHGNWSSNLRLRLRYTPEAQGEKPERLFLKLVNTNTGDGEYFDDSEVRYYTRDYLDVPDAPLARCYHGAYSQELRRYHVLLEDLSETHVPANEKTPTLAYGLALAEALAILHARWWGAEKLARAGVEMHSAAHIQRFVAISEPGAGHLLERYASELAPHWPELMRETFARHPARLVERTQDANGFTLIHGDAGEYNILVPRQGEHPLYLIDRQPFDWSLTTWLGAYDLVYILVMDWEIEARREWEMSVLQRYHARLMQLGVSGYPWERLLEDYRLCLPMGVYIASEYFRGGVNEAQWQRFLGRNLRRILSACDDWRCAESW